MKSSILAKGISVTSPRHLLCWKAPAVVTQWWLVIAQGLVGTITAPLAVPGPVGALSLLAHHWDQETCPCLGEILTTLKSGCPHCPVIAVALPSTVSGQEAWGAHLAAPPGSSAAPSSCLQEPGAPPHWRSPRVPCGKEPWISGERQLLSLCSARGFCPPSAEPRGRSRAIPSAAGMESPSLRPAPMERDHGAFSLMQCYEYSGSFCSLFNGFECEKVVELGRGEERGEARPLCSGMLLQPWIYLAFGGLWGLSLLPSPAKARSLFCLMLISIAAAQERG